MDATATAIAPQFPEYYDQLRKMARARLRAHQPFTLMGTTELVHESYLKLASAGSLCPDDRTAYLNYVGAVMRSVIVDAARKRLAQRRDCGAAMLDSDELAACIADAPAGEIMQVHEALDTLYQIEPRLAQVMTLCYFAGMNELEIGACLGVSDRTVRRAMSKATLMLRAILAA